MATEWKRTRETKDLLSRNYYEGIGPDGEPIKIRLRASGDKNADGLWTDGLRHNNLLTRGTQKQFDKMLNHFFTTGNVPTPELLKLRSTDKAWENLIADFNDVMAYNEFDVEDYQNKLYAANPNNPEVFNPNSVNNNNNNINSMDNLFGFDTPGTVGNTLYDIYRQANQDQFESSMQESQYMEKDLNRMVGQERQALIDNIREDRKKMLKSGLSQSAIANREIQGLLQGQNIATELGTGFLGERRNLMQMGNNIDSMAKTQALDSINAGIGNTYAGITTSQSGDYSEMIKKYLGSSRKFQDAFERFYEKN